MAPEETSPTRPERRLADLRLAPRGLDVSVFPLP
jgi:hypothetical protein